MHDIKKRLDKIFEKYNEYISFTYTRSARQEHKWNIYTPTIKHNYFTDRGKFIQFLDSLICTTPKEYRVAELERWKEKRDWCKEKLEDIERCITDLETEESHEQRT